MFVKLLSMRWLHQNVSYKLSAFALLRSWRLPRAEECCCWLRCRESWLTLLRALPNSGSLWEQRKGGVDLVWEGQANGTEGYFDLMQCECQSSTSHQEKRERQQTFYCSNTSDDTQVVSIKPEFWTWPKSSNFKLLRRSCRGPLCSKVGLTPTEHCNESCIFSNTYGSC